MKPNITTEKKNVLRRILSRALLATVTGGQLSEQSLSESVELSNPNNQRGTHSDLRTSKP